MISGKDITIDKDGSIILNGDKYPLASQAEIDAVKGDIGDLTQTGLTGVSVAEQLSEINGDLTKQAVTVTKTSAVTSNSGILAHICNNFCFVTMDANIQSGAVDGTVLATGFTKPINFGAIGRTSEAFDIMINSSGELIIKGTPTTGWVQGSISYMI